MDLSVIGLGKLGSPMAACFAAKGHRVTGVDVNANFVRAINELRPPVFEPGLEDMLARTEGRLRATTDIEEAVGDCDMVFMIVPTPSEANGSFSLKYVLPAAASIGAAMRTASRFPVIVLTSTVMPGTTGGAVRAALESASGKRCGVDFGLCYSPEFISLGSVIRDFLHPDFILIGESDQRSGELLGAFYQQVCENRPPVARMAFANAELTKLALNTFVTTKISYANLLAAICEKLEGGDVDAVTRALGLDSRIGPKYLKGSLGYGGPCFPRDNQALVSLARRLGVFAPLPEATDQINSHQVPRLKELVEHHLPAGGRVGILGLAYKPQTNVIERAQGTELAQELLAEGHGVSVYDPCALDAARPVLKGDVTFAESAADCIAQADVVILCNPSAEFKALRAEDFVRADRQVTVIDCWRLLDRERLGDACHYVAIGNSNVRNLVPTRVLAKAG